MWTLHRPDPFRWFRMRRMRPRTMLQCRLRLATASPSRMWSPTIRDAEVPPPRKPHWWPAKRLRQRSSPRRSAQCSQTVVGLEAHRTLETQLYVKRSSSKRYHRRTSRMKRPRHLPGGDDAGGERSARYTRLPPTRGTESSLSGRSSGRRSLSAGKRRSRRPARDLTTRAALPRAASPATLARTVSLAAFARTTTSVPRGSTAEVAPSQSRR
mmetsp:Transcript_24705/g.61751  ORF Transcript_24705/g.61751 Transcript_24705/m.61751 type:complete len:212 (-) Transcript_24705:553-1188(-)